MDAPCLDCGESMVIVMKDEQLISAEPEGIVGYAYRTFGGPRQDPAPEGRGFR